jgi:hypothetical protein
MIDFIKLFALLDQQDPRITLLPEPGPKINLLRIVKNRLITIQNTLFILDRDPNNPLRWKARQILGILLELKKSLPQPEPEPELSGNE